MTIFRRYWPNVNRMGVDYITDIGRSSANRLLVYHGYSWGWGVSRSGWAMQTRPS